MAASQHVTCDGSLASPAAPASQLDQRVSLCPGRHAPTLQQCNVSMCRTALSLVDRASFHHAYPEPYSPKEEAAMLAREAHILVVEDDVDNRFILLELLRRMGVGSCMGLADGGQLL